MTNTTKITKSYTLIERDTGEFIIHDFDNHEGYVISKKPKEFKNYNRALRSRRNIWKKTDVDIDIIEYTSVYQLSEKKLEYNDAAMNRLKSLIQEYDVWYYDDATYSIFKDIPDTTIIDTIDTNNVMKSFEKLLSKPKNTDVRYAFVMGSFQPYSNKEIKQTASVDYHRNMFVAKTDTDLAIMKIYLVGKFLFVYDFEQGVRINV